MQINKSRLLGLPLQKRCFRFYSSSLALLHVLFRHGDRTPTRGHSFPTDPHQHLTYFPFGWGNLTNEGKQRSFKLGENLRQRYDQYLGDYFIPEELEARSTDFHRTQMTLQLVLAGLFPPKAEQMWRKNLNWQPIPYAYVKRKDDEVSIYNQTYMTAYRSYQQTSGTAEKYKKLFEYLTEHTGRVIDTTREVWKIAFTLQITLQIQIPCRSYEEFSLKLAPWSKSVWRSPVLDVAKEDYFLSVATPELRNLAIGNFLRKIVADTREKISGKSRVKLHLYSGHEKNIAQVLISLNMFVPHVPKYGACLMVEVHRDGTSYVVKIFYQTEPEAEMTLLKFKNKPSCEFQEFSNIINDYFKT